MLLTELTHFLAGLFTTAIYPPDEQGGIFHLPNSDMTGKPVSHIGLALEPEPGLAEWIRTNQIDALWLHRPWKLDLTSIPANVAVLYHHLPFDEHLTIGYNQWMANALGITPETQVGSGEAIYPVIGYKQAHNLPARPIGLIGRAPGLDFGGWLYRINDEFGGYDEVHPGAGKQPNGNGVAIVGAMNDALIREAADRGVGIYITGQFRKAAQQALDETGMGVIAIGHQRSEEWGLLMLADLLQSQPNVEAVSVWQANR